MDLIEIASVASRLLFGLVAANGWHGGGGSWVVVVGYENGNGEKVEAVEEMWISAADTVSGLQGNLGMGVAKDAGGMDFDAVDLPRQLDNYRPRAGSSV